MARATLPLILTSTRSQCAAREEALRNEIAGLQEQLGLVSTIALSCQPLRESPRQGEDPEQVVNKHIKLLHDYNEAKDAAQVRLQSCLARL